MVYFKVNDQELVLDSCFFWAIVNFAQSEQVVKIV